MAQPTGIKKHGRAALKSGCPLGLFPADPEYNIEIQRAPDSGGSPGTPATIAVVSGYTEVFVDEQAAGADPWHYRIRHVRTGETESGWTPYVAIIPSFFMTAARPAPALPSTDERPTDDGATGTLTLIVTDTQNRLVKVEAKYRSGNGTEEATWDELTESGGEYTKTVDLALKHPSTVRYRITHYDEDGIEISREKVVPFPLASKPAKPEVTLTLATNGDVTAHVEGDPDTVNIRAKGSTSAYPNEAAVDAETPIAGSSVDTGVLVNLNTGDTAYVSVRAYDSTPTGSDLAKAKLTAISEELNDPPIAPSLVVLTVTIDTLEVVS